MKPASSQKKESMAEVTAAFEKLRTGFRTERYPSAAAREDRLERLESLLLTRREALVAAISADFGGRARHESVMADIVLTLEGVRQACSRVREWMQPRPAATHVAYLGSSAWVEPIPLGVVAILSPWNYPVNLALAPLAGVLAAGNRALMKPSEVTPASSAVLARAVREFFSAEEVAVVEGGPEVARKVTELPFDHIVFTGSTRVGREVAMAAAKNLVPTTLELGGKSPVLIHADYPVASAATRVAVGKIFNAGQTCIAPDYVLVAEGKEEVFADAFSAAVREAFPDPSASADYTSVVNQRAWDRLRALLDDARAKGARVVDTCPDVFDAGRRRMAPALVLGATGEMRVMQEEIFGPVLPVLGYRTLDDALAIIDCNSHPLAFYVFDEDEARATETLRRVPSGDACINETLAHFAQEDLPFGGVGTSGTGAYHGRAGFERFSHARGVLSVNSLSPARFLFGPLAPKLTDYLADFVSGRVARWLLHR